MSGLLRYTQKLFGINAGTNQMSKYGSRIQAAPGQRYSGATINPSIVQELSAFMEGQYAAMAGARSPFIPDHNSLFYLAFYQLSYLLTRGIPEWDSGTTYNTNDFCKVGSVQYYSLIDSNTNIPPASDSTKWRSNQLIIPTKQIFTSGTGTYNATVVSGQKPKYAKIKLIGAGGGGQGSAADGTAGGDGANGTETKLGSYEASGGNGGSSMGPGEGGYQNGGDSLNYDFEVVTNGQIMLAGGEGGNSILGGAGRGGGFYNNSGTEGFFGGGGGGAYVRSTNITFDMQSGVGGGSGQGIELIVPITDIDGTLYSIGVGGAGGSAGTGGFAGSKGGDGYIEIEEHYYV